MFGIKLFKNSLSESFNSYELTINKKPGNITVEGGFNHDEFNQESLFIKFTNDKVIFKRYLVFKKQTYSVDESFSYDTLHLVRFEFENDVKNIDHIVFVPKKGDKISYPFRIGPNQNRCAVCAELEEIASTVNEVIDGKRTEL